MSSSTSSSSSSGNPSSATGPGSNGIPGSSRSSATSPERRRPYPFDRLERKWQAHWEEHATFHVPNPGEPGFDPARPKYYVLDMFPYPSGAGLHVGHPEGYTATDIVARYKRMRGFNVLHPMGWDAFGLPAEQHAIKTGEHPGIQTRRNIDNFRRQLKAIGFAYDWQREIDTTDPGYFRWTQWIFLQLYHAWFNPETNRAEPIATYRGAEPAHVRLAYVSEAPVNWSPDLGTVLANEEVEEWRAKGHIVERRPMRQWMLRITAYAQRLIDELDGLDWPEGIKLLQRNWIGRSEGAEVRFGIAGSEAQLTVFTTRPDTLFGATYLVLAPEHKLVDEITTEEQWPAVRDYREKTTRKSDLERTELAKEKTGVFTGAHAVNPVNRERIPIWIADYVMPGYGTGAIMAVPAHDERDWEFAKKFRLPIRQVVAPAEDTASIELSLHRAAGEDAAGRKPNRDDVINGEHTVYAQCFTGDGIAVNSPLIEGLLTSAAKTRITAWLEEQGVGKKTVNYKLRDWLFSRQRYWGEPFPIIWREGRHEALPESELPLVPPPLDDFKPTGTGEPPLARATEWIRYSDAARRETNTMPQWAGSCWYYLRYCDPRNDGRFVGEEAERYWMAGSTTAAAAAPAPETAAGVEANQAGEAEIHPRGLPRSPDEIQHEELGPIVGGEPSDGAPAATATLATVPAAGTSQSPAATASAAVSPRPNVGGVDLYVGGTEHAVLHLLYARFWHKVLFDLGHVSTPEPFQRLVNQGIILGEDGQKMSKSRGNVINPDDVIGEHGADAFRCYEMFMGPLEQMKPWSMTGVEGVSRFLARVWRLVMEENQAGEWMLSPSVQDVPPEKAQLKVIHATIKKVGEDIEMLSFNTALSQMMIFVNAFVNAPAKPVSALRTLMVLLNPFAPHLTSELWEILRRNFPNTPEQERDVADQPWPAYDAQQLVEDEIEVALQVNGKVRDKIVVKKGASKDEVEQFARSSPRIKEWIGEQTIRKVIVVPGKLVNVVV